MARHGKNHPPWWLWLAITVLLGTAAAIFILGAVHNESHPAVHLPSATAPSQPVPQPVVFPPRQAPPPHRIAVMSYRVKPGDNLWDIAQTHCGNALDWVSLWHANKIKNPNLIFPRMVINLVC